MPTTLFRPTKMKQVPKLTRTSVINLKDIRITELPTSYLKITVLFSKSDNKGGTTSIEVTENHFNPSNKKVTAAAINMYTKYLYRK
jgi:hypothetical protein